MTPTKVSPAIRQFCGVRLPGHLHCVHGHVTDCPKPGDCEYPQLEARRTPHDYEPGDYTHPAAVDPDCAVCGRTKPLCERELDAPS